TEVPDKAGRRIPRDEIPLTDEAWGVKKLRHKWVAKFSLNNVGMVLIANKDHNCWYSRLNQLVHDVADLQQALMTNRNIRMRMLQARRSRVDRTSYRDSDNQQLLQLTEKDVVSSVATVLSDLCGPGEWMPMEKLHAECD
ncbi:hypothetical protein Tco_1088761, partial [Tanacetum coccineum]